MNKILDSVLLAKNPPSSIHLLVVYANYVYVTRFLNLKVDLLY